MTVYEDLTIAVIVVVAAVTIGAIYVGVLGLLGGYYIVRCPSCQHWTLTVTDRPRGSCTRCRHPVLMHQLRVIHHPRQASVLGLTEQSPR
jgi:hypothetical protein